MSEPAVLSARDGDVVTLTFNRPDRLNAMAGPSFEAMNDALDQALADGARALVLTGAGRAFNTGADLQSGAAAGLNADMGATLDATWNPLIRRLVELPVPVVAAVNGPAAGAGVGVALACDFVLMARSAYLLLAFVNIGLIPDAGTTFFLSRLAGPQRARALMMLGERLPAETAEAWGLIHCCVDDTELSTAAAALAARLAAGPTRSLAAMKAALRRSLDTDLTTTLDAERDAQREMGRSDDFREGVMSFLQKRPPVFSGR